MDSSGPPRVPRRLGQSLAFASLMLAACAVLSVIASASQQKTAPKSHDSIWRQAAPEMVQRGQSQFRKTCSFCHGPDANGGSEGPNLMRSEVVRHDENGNLIGPVILEGRPDKGMPAFKLAPDDIHEIVAFLRYRLAESDRRSPK